MSQSDSRIYGNATTTHQKFIDTRVYTINWGGIIIRTNQHRNTEQWVFEAEVKNNFDFADPIYGGDGYGKCVSQDLDKPYGEPYGVYRETWQKISGWIDDSDSSTSSI